MSYGLDHRIGGAAAGATYAAVLNLPPTQTVVCMWLATIASAGKTSPDIDQYPQWSGDRKDVEQWWWVPKLRAVLLAIGPRHHGDPTDHRRITHWPGLPALWGAVLLWVHLSLPAADPVRPEGLTELLGWAAVLAAHLAVLGAGALIAGWTSHLALDWPFGQGNRHRGPGIPFMPWWSHHGLGRKSKGWASHLTVWLIIVPGAAATFLRYDVVDATVRTCLGG